MGTRDQLVLLGRRGSGKSVYLARLHHDLSGGAGALRLHANDESDRARFEAIIAGLRDGCWPAPSTGARPIALTIGLGDRTGRTVVMDYAGDLVDDAFARGRDNEITGHLDRAAAVIVLLDPGPIGIDDDASDDDVLSRAIERVRATPGGEAIPIAVVFTKCDVHQQMIRDGGGLNAFMAERYPKLLAAGSPVKVFGSAAVFAQADGRPNLAEAAVGIVEPLRFAFTARRAVAAPTPDQKPDPTPDPAMSMPDPIDAGFALEAAAMAAPTVGAAPTAPAQPHEGSTSSLRWAVRGAGGVLAVLVISLVIWVAWALNDALEPPPAPGSAARETVVDDRPRLDADELLDLAQQTVCRVVVRQYLRVEQNRFAKIPYSLGTGFVVSSDGLILTNRHVVDDQQRLRADDDVIDTDIVAVFHRGEQTLVLDPTTPVLASPRYDLAWFRVEQRFERPLQFAPTPPDGEPVRAYGFPMVNYEMLDIADMRFGDYNEFMRRLGTADQPSIVEWLGGTESLLPTVTAGSIRGVHEMDEGLHLQTNAIVSEGNSGGPLLDYHGRVLGIVSFKLLGEQQRNFALAGFAVWEDLRLESGINWPEGW